MKNKNKRIIYIFGFTLIFIVITWVIREQNSLTNKKVDYFKNGNIKSSYTIIDGKKEGEELLYYENGKIKSIRSYHDGELHGELRQNYINGSIEYKGEYNNGERVNEHLWYYKNGNLRRIIEYDQTGFESGFNEFDSTGSISNEILTYFLPKNEDDTVKLNSVFKARIFIGNRISDSLVYVVDSLLYEDSLIYKQKVLENKDLYTDFEFKPQMEGTYYIKGKAKEYNPNDSTYWVIPFEYTFYVVN